MLFQPAGRGDPRIHHHLDSSFGFGGSVEGAGTTFVIFGSNLGSGCGNPEGVYDRKTRGGGDGFEGPDGQLSIVKCVLLLEMDFEVKGVSFEEVVKEFSHLDVPHLRM
ncbi:hypothetical protein Tco_1217956 [Tanacetum coccineum]